MVSDDFWTTWSHGNFAMSFWALAIAIGVMIYRDKLSAKLLIAMLVFFPLFLTVAIRLGYSFMGRITDIPGDFLPWGPFWWEHKGATFAVLAAIAVPAMSLIITYLLSKKWPTWLMITIGVYFASFAMTFLWGPH